MRRSRIWTPLSGGDAPASRRALLTSAAVAGLTVAGLAGCGGSGVHPHVSTTAKVPDADVSILRGLLNLENETVAAYQAGIPLLDAASAADAEQFLRHELSHVGELSGLIKQATGSRPAPQGGYALGHPRTAAEVLALLHHLEQSQLAAYVQAIVRLSPGPVRVAVASVFANDAQHVAVLRQHLHRAPAPAPFVTGRE